MQTLSVLLVQSIIPVELLADRRLFPAPVHVLLTLFHIHHRYLDYSSLQAG